MRILVIGSAEQSAGGVSSAIKLMKKMPAWKKFNCYWLGTQIQRNYLWKLWYAIKGNFVAFFVMWKYSIVHMHTTPDKLGLLIQLPILLWAKCLRKKVVLHLHVGNQLKTKKNSLFVFCLKKADRIVLLAKKWENLFSTHYPEVSVPTSVIYNACENISEVSFDEKEKRIMMAAWYNENKAADLLLKAWKSIKDDYPEWKVDMLGNGEVDRYKQMSEDMGLSDSVTFTGYVTGNERENYFRKASIYCMCSYEEGFPMVVLEAWMYGINVVTTPVGGLPDVIDEGKNCLTFDFGDWQKLAKQLRVLMDDESKRNEMAASSREFAVKHFSMDKISMDMESLYKEV